jgi:hypothetical protein
MGQSHQSYNIGEITEAMQTIATDSALRSRFSSQGIIQSQQFSWEKQESHKSSFIPLPVRYKS